MAAIHHPPRWFRSSAAGLECKRLQACKRKSYTGPWCMNTKKPPPPWVEFCLHPEVTWSTNEDLRRTPRPKNHYKIKEAYIIIYRNLQQLDHVGISNTAAPQPHSARDLPAGQDLHDGLEGVAGGGEVGARASPLLPAHASRNGFLGVIPWSLLSWRREARENHAFRGWSLSNWGTFDRKP